MKDTQLQILVAETIALDRDVKEKTELLKEKKTLLIHEAESRPDECSPTDGGGKSIEFKALNGESARVTFPASELKSKIDGEGRTIEKVRTAAKAFFDRLFRPVLGYRPVDNFRDEAVSLLGRKDGGKLIDLCEKDSSPRVSFETSQ
jgi:hypothetical protein